MQTKNSQPEGKQIMPEMRFTKLHALSVDPRVEISQSASETEDKVNKASQAIQSPRTVPFFLLVSLLDGYSFANVLVKGIVAFKH